MWPAAPSAAWCQIPWFSCCASQRRLITLIGLPPQVESRKGQLLPTHFHGLSPNTKKLALVTFLANLYFYNAVGTLYQQARGLSLLQVSSIGSIIIVTIFVAEVPTGVIADRIGRKWSVVTAIALQAIGEWLYLFASGYPAFVLIAILAGVGYAFLSGANEALIYDSLPTDDRDQQMQRSMGILGGAYQLAFFVAPLIGGLIVAHLQLEEFRRVILLTALSVSVAFGVSLTLEEPASAFRHSEKSPLSIFRDGFAEVRRSPKLRRLLMVSMFTSTFSGLLVALYQPFFAEQHVTTFWIGAALAFGGLLAAASQVLAYKLETWTSPSVAMVLLTVTPGVAYVLLAMARLPAMLVPIFVLTYGLAEARSPLFSAYRNRLIATEHRATVLSLMSMITSLYLAAAMLILGRVAEYSVPLTFAIVGVGVLLAAALLRVDRIPRLVADSEP